MTSLSPDHEGPFPDSNAPTHETTLLPATRETSPPTTYQSSEAGQRQSEPDQKQDQPWKPRVDRRQSWSTEDHKHELQEQWVRAQQKGEQMGFTEREM